MNPDRIQGRGNPVAVTGDFSHRYDHLGVADEQSVRRGKAIAVTKCSYCHSIERAGRSPRTAAPPFRTLHKRYPVETLEDALAEGMSTGHPRMPEFRLDPDQVGDFISFLKSLE